MIAYSYKDIKAKVNDAEIYCTSADFTNSAQYEPSFNTESRSAFDYAPSAPTAGSISLEYFLTGKDLLGNFPVGSSGISIDLGGIHVDAGYLNSYTLSAQPFSPIVASVEIAFFEEMDTNTMTAGSFLGMIATTLGTSVPVSKLPDNVTPLNVSDMTIDGGVYVEEGKLASLTYSYGTEHSASYSINKKDGASNVTMGAQRVEVSFEIYDYDMHLLPTGPRENFKINLNDKNQDLQQSFNVNSQIGTKNLSIVSSEGVFRTQVKMGQANLGVFDNEKVEITALIPEAGDTGDLIEIQGNNFVDVEKVLLGQFPCSISEGYTDSSLSFLVSRDVPSGYKAPVHVITNGMKASSPSSFTATNGIVF